MSLTRARVNNSNRQSKNRAPILPEELRLFLDKRRREVIGLALLAMSAILLLALFSYSPADPSLNSFGSSGASDIGTQNILGKPGAMLSDILLQSLGLAAYALTLPLLSWGIRYLRKMDAGRAVIQFPCWLLAPFFLAPAFTMLTAPDSWSLSAHLGGSIGPLILSPVATLLQSWLGLYAHSASAGAFGLVGLLMLGIALGPNMGGVPVLLQKLWYGFLYALAFTWELSLLVIDYLGRLSQDKEKKPANAKRSDKPAFKPAEWLSQKLKTQHKETKKEKPIITENTSKSAVKERKTPFLGNEPKQQAQEQSLRSNAKIEKAAAKQKVSSQTGSLSLPLDTDYQLPPVDLLQNPPLAAKSPAHAPQ